MRRIIWASGIFLILLLGFLIFYRPKPLAVRKELEAESELHKVKRITSQQVEAEALRLGDSLTSIADSLLLVRLSPILSQPSGLKAALAQYPPHRYPEVQAGAKKYGVSVNRLAQASPPPPQASSQVQIVSQTEILYNKPIFITKTLCLRCHGEVSKDIPAPDLAVLKNTYPGYKLTGFKSGEHIGSWELKFSRPTILQKLSRQKRKLFRPK